MEDRFFDQKQKCRSLWGLIPKYCDASPNTLPPLPTPMPHYTPGGTSYFRRLQTCVYLTRCSSYIYLILPNQHSFTETQSSDTTFKATWGAVCTYISPNSIPALQCERRFWRSANLSQNLYDRLGIVKQRRLQYLHIFHQTSNYVLKCEVRKLWYIAYISSFWSLANFTQNLYDRSGILSNVGCSTYTTHISPNQHSCTEMRSSQSVVSRRFEDCILVCI